MSSRFIFLATYSGVTYALAGCSLLVSRMIKSQMQYRPLAQKKYLRLVQATEIATFVLLWFGTSVTFVLYNKWLFFYWGENGFAYPLTATTGHMVIKVILSRLFLRCRCSPCYESIDPVPAALLLRVIIPIAFCTTADIALSNLSFKLVTVTFYTIIKTGTLLWVLLWAVIFGLEKFSLGLVGTVVLITGGLFLSTYGDTEMSVIGLTFILAASCASGIRWGLVQILQAYEENSFHSLAIIYHIAPWSTLFMMLAALGVELPEILRDNSYTINMAAEATFLILLGGLTAFVLILVELKVVAITSSLTLGVFGTTKELIQIALAVIIFRDAVTWFNVIGLILAVGGTLLYKILRAKNEEDVEYNLVAQADLELEEFGLDGSDED